MNGIAFANIPRLSGVDLSGNVCVDEIFTTQPFVGAFRRAISRNCATNNFTKKEISCKIFTSCDDRFKGSPFELFNRASGCCELESGTYTDSSEYSFIASEDYASLEAIFIQFQGNMEFLPVSVHERFHALKIYSIANTPVKKVSKKNFEKLFKLEILRLVDNRIEDIKSNTFEDLTSLKTLSLGRSIISILFPFKLDSV